MSESPFAAIRYLDETGSTNEDAAALLGDDRYAGLTIVAERQTRGAGRKGRTWTAQAGTALLFTTILPRALPAGDLWIVPFWVALAVRRALRASGIAATLHWPNDLLLAEHKLAGILCTSRIAGNLAWVACGVGINVHRRPGAEAEIAPPPAFCDDVRPVERADLLREVLLAYRASLADLAAPQRIARIWEAAAGIPGQRYLIAIDGGASPFEATALALATGGGLVVRRADGTRETISLADARALRR